jgi:hypothetical protein
MMNYYYGSMMAGGGWFFGIISWLVVITDLILLGIWLWKQITKK